MRPQPPEYWDVYRYAQLTVNQQAYRAILAGFNKEGILGRSALKSAHNAQSTSHFTPMETMPGRHYNPCLTGEQTEV